MPGFHLIIRRGLESRLIFKRGLESQKTFQQRMRVLPHFQMGSTVSPEFRIWLQNAIRCQLFNKLGQPRPQCRLRFKHLSPSKTVYCIPCDRTGHRVDQSGKDLSKTHSHTLILIQTALRGSTKELWFR